MPDIDPEDLDGPPACERHPECDTCKCESCPARAPLLWDVIQQGCPTNTCTWPMCADETIAGPRSGPEA